MAITLTSLHQILDHGFDDIIDVRAPAEWGEDHIPGSINLPVLDDEERARIGTIYKQVNPFTARKMGAALVAQNSARHLQGSLADRPGGWQPLVYCWRGGQRSGSFAMILGQIGWRVETISGGYKAYRALVVDRLYAQGFPSPVILIDGNTGSAKTVLLQLLAARGVQVIDLEGLARHRGSLFGGMAGGQPSQKSFETGLAMAVERLDPSRPVVIEAESSKIGQCRVPVSVWKAMLAAPRIEVAASMEARARFLVTRYPDLVEDADQLRGVIASLRRLQPAERLEDWQKLADAGDFGTLAQGLMTHHYDPRYKRNRDQNREPVAQVELRAMDDADLARAGDELVRMISRISER